MPESASALSSWESFYVIVGTSGGALVGLQFVVVTLLAGRRDLAVEDTLDAFGTPTVVHLAGALTLSAIMSAPWHSLDSLSVVTGMCGVAGLAYGAIVVARTLRQTNYKPVWQDWMWFEVLPCVCYAALAVTAVLLRTNADLALFVTAAVALGLLLIGIHNAWDSVIHIAISPSRDDAAPGDQGRRY
jgi:hypothetical protein